MSARCLTPIKFCAFRVTRLDALGNVAAGPNNSYVSGHAIQMQVTPDIDAGTERVLRNGCDCIAAQYKPDPILKRWNLVLDRDALEPGLEEMLLGNTIILDGSDPIGIIGAADAVCAGLPKVAFEAWLELYDDDHQASDWPYAHYVWPSTTWSPSGSETFGTDFTQPQLTAFSRSNPLWGHGPYTPAQPVEIGTYGYFYTADAPPAASCGYETVTPGS
jgi:hypothetical protein